MADQVMEEAQTILMKRKRERTPPNKSPTDKRAPKREKLINRNLFDELNDASDDEETKEEVKEEKKLCWHKKKLIPKTSTPTTVNTHPHC